MKRRSPRRSPAGARRRTTLTLPADSLSHAERIARARKSTLSAVIAEALADGLEMRRAAERSEEVLGLYKRAFAGFSDAEMSILDGLLLEPANKRR